MNDTIRRDVFRLLLIKGLALGLIWWLFFRSEPPVTPPADHIYALDSGRPTHPSGD